MHNQRIDTLHDKLDSLIQTLKNNRLNVPLSDLKSKYLKSYNDLLINLTQTASDYAKNIVLEKVRIHRDFVELIIPVVEQSIKSSGILKRLADSIFIDYSINDFDNFALQLRDIVQSELNTFYLLHCGLYITEESLNNPTISPKIYCLVNNSILQDNKWLPLTIKSMVTNEIS